MIQLDFIKETNNEPKYWLVGLYSYELSEDCVLGNSLVVKYIKLIYRTKFQKKNKLLLTNALYAVLNLNEVILIKHYQ